jgi:hypothetical protein
MSRSCLLRLGYGGGWLSSLGGWSRVRPVRIYGDEGRSVSFVILNEKAEWQARLTTKCKIGTRSDMAPAIPFKAESSPTPKVAMYVGRLMFKGEGKYEVHSV